MPSLSRSNRIFSLLAACLLLAALPAPAPAQEAGGDEPAAAAPEEDKQPSIVLEIRGMHYDAGEPIPVRVTARNDGDDTVPNPLTDPVLKGFVLTGADGKALKPESAGSAAPRLQPQELAGGAYFGQIIDLLPHFPALKGKGRYELSYRAGGEESNSVTVNVIEAYDPEASYKAVIKTSKGDITLQLYREDAPLTVRNFVDLARQGFYDGLTFHYIRPGDLIMGGDPRGDGTGGSGFVLPAEFNSRQHLAGTIAMVRGSDPNSASSQFYICLTPQPERDGRFTVFGQVVDGMDALNRLAEVPTSGRNEKPYFRPLEPEVIESVTIVQESAEEAQGS